MQFRFLLKIQLVTAMFSPTIYADSAKNQTLAAVKNEQVIDVAAELKALSHEISKQNHFSLHFRQEIYRDLRKRTSTVLGLAYFSRPKRFRWIVQEPDSNEWIFDGNDLYFDDLKRKQGTRYHADTAQARELRQVVDLIVDFAGVGKNYTAHDAKKTAAALEFKLTPVKSSNVIELEVEIDRKQNYLKKLKLLFEGKNSSTFYFDQFKTYDSSPVTFAPYSGIKVMDAKQ